MGSGFPDTNLYAINPDGSERWRFATGGSIRSPAIGPNGTVYVGSSSFQDNHLYVINADGSERWRCPPRWELTQFT